MFYLMNEINYLLQHILSYDSSSEPLSYQKIFIHHIGIDPLLAEKE